MAFKVNPDSTPAVDTAAAPVVATATVPPAVDPTPAAATTTTLTPPSEKVDLTPLLSGILSQLSLTKITESQSIAYGALKGAHGELWQGLAAIAVSFGLDTESDTAALRYMPRKVTEEGKTSEPYLICFSLVQNAEGSCDFRWVDQTVSLPAGGSVYEQGFRALGTPASKISIPSHSCPVSVRLAQSLKPEQKAAVPGCETFGQLSEFLTTGGGGIKSDLPDGFMMTLTKPETLKSKKGTDYTVLHGVELNADSTPKADCSIFSPTPADYWDQFKVAVVLVFSAKTKTFQVLSAVDGSELATVKYQGKTAKLKDLPEQSSWHWHGTYRTHSDEWGDGWKIEISPDGKIENAISVYANATVENYIEDHYQDVAKSAGAEFTSNVDDPLADFTSTEAFGTVQILGHTKVSNGISVGVVLDLNLTESQQDEIAAGAALLGLKVN